MYILECFHILAIVINIAININVSFWITVVFFFLNIYPGVELLGHMVILFLAFWEMSILFSTVAAQIYISTSSVKVFCFFTSSSTYVISGLFDDNHSDHSSTLAWKIPWMEEPGGLKSLGSIRVGHDWVISLLALYLIEGLLLVCKDNIKWL